MRKNQLSRLRKVSFVVVLRREGEVSIEEKLLGEMVNDRGEKGTICSI